MFTDLIASMDRDMLETLGGPVVYQPGVGAAVSLTGIFDAQFVLVLGSSDAGVETARPAVFLLLEDLPVEPELDDPILTIDDLDYRVVERRPDGARGIVLVLRALT